MAGSHLISLARAWLDADRVARVFEPLLADWQQEHQALTGLARARSWLRVHACFGWSFLLSLPDQIKRPISEPVLIVGWVAAEGFAALGVAVQIYLFDAGLPGARDLIPAAIGMALPLALVPAVIVLAKYGGPVEARTMTLRLVLLSMIVLVPLLSWITPISNQAFREAQAPLQQPAIQQPVPRGDRELTLPELLSARPPADLLRKRAAHWNDTRREALLERASVFLMPITMGLLGLAVAGVSRRRSWLNAVIWWIVAANLWASTLGIRWAPGHALLLALALMLHWYGRRRERALTETVA